MTALNPPKNLNIKCKKCLKGFDDDEEMHTYKNTFYHSKCFMCNFCDQSLSGKGAFFTKPDGSLQCHPCHEYHAPKCFICEKAIPDGVKYNIYQGKHFHRNCFKCVKCNGVIPEGKQFMLSPEGLQCADCSKLKTPAKPAAKK